jgi:hypothetical protein
MGACLHVGHAHAAPHFGAGALRFSEQGFLHFRVKKGNARKPL